jgi:hypothetical protein
MQNIHKTIKINRILLQMAVFAFRIARDGWASAGRKSHLENGLQTK